jgi:putative tricarboxylic transport membrane protein
VRADSPYKSLKDIAAAIKKNPGKIDIAGASSPGSMDHLSAAMVLQAGKVSWRDWNYIPAAKGGGDAMTMLLSSKHIAALSIGATSSCSCVSFRGVPV